MNDDVETWTIEHFSQANPSGPGQDNVADLLRRVAGTLDSLGAIEVQDVVFHSEINDGVDWPSLTVYLHRIKSSKDEAMLIALQADI